MARRNRKTAEFCKLGHKMARDKEGEWRCAECRREYRKRYHYILKIRAYEREHDAS